MSFLEKISIDLYSGDPFVRTWPLVENDYLPLILCTLYAITIKILGPSLMRHREPFKLRFSMIAYNFCLVVTYTVVIWRALNMLMIVDRNILCYGGPVVHGTIPYKIVSIGWIIYLLKYVELLDSAFFVLRKKDYLLSNLHVIHHFSLPLIGWILLRTEKSGYSAFPIILNSIMHIFMYTYYGLAAMGPSVQKYLWWKKYLTMMQMGQFVLIVLFVCLMPLSGCKIVSIGFVVMILGAIGFFSLFFNFYQHAFNKPTKHRHGRKEK